MNESHNNITISIEELVNLIVKKSNSSSLVVREFINVLFSTIEDALIVGDTVKVKGLGVFEPQWNEPKEIQDQEQNTITVDGYYSVQFIPSESLRQLVNEPFAHLERITLNVPNFKPTNIGLSNKKQQVGGKEAIEPLKVFQDQAKEIKNLLYEIGSMKQETVSPPSVAQPTIPAAPSLPSEQEEVEAKSDEKEESDFSENQMVTPPSTKDEITVTMPLDAVSTTESEVVELSSDVAQSGVDTHIDLVAPVSVNPKEPKNDVETSVDDFDIVYDFAEKKSTIGVEEVGEQTAEETVAVATPTVETDDNKEELEADDTTTTIEEEGKLVEEPPVFSETVVEKEPPTDTNTETTPIEVPTTHTTDDAETDDDEDVAIIEDVEEEIELIAPPSTPKEEEKSTVVEATEELPTAQQYTDDGVIYTVDTEIAIESEVTPEDGTTTTTSEPTPPVPIEPEEIADEENDEEKKKNFPWMYIVGASILFGALVFLFSPKIMEQIGSKKKVNKFDYIADSVSEALKIQQIKDSIYKLKVEEEQQASDSLSMDVDNDSIVPVAMQEFTEATPTPTPTAPKTSTTKTEKRTTMTATNSDISDDNIFSVPRTYDEVLEEITFERGMNMSALARKYYGHTDYWVYIYEANKSVIRNPNNVPVGVKLKIPKMDKRIIDPNSELSKAYALELKKKYLK